MIDIQEAKNCCGCTACASICPKSAIQMKSDKEGFLYPYIEKSLCVNCSMCDRVCPVLHKDKIIEETKGYIIRNIDEEIVRQSTSGGAFTVFAEELLKDGACIYGTGYDENMKVICKEANDSRALEEMRGSKFVQSYLGNTFIKIREQLKEKKSVLFTGTPCQVSGLIHFLGEKPENLWCIDFVCRGVPSPGLWDNYVQMMQNKYKSKMVGARFKNKTYGYHATTMKIDFENGKTWYGSGRIDPMMKAFVNELASRPSCGDCKFKGEKRLSDITMFDCYEFQQIMEMKDDDKGYTSLLIHSKKGEELLNRIKDKIICYEVPIEKLITKNGIMVNYSARPNKNRDVFYRIVENHTISRAIDEVSPITYKDYIIEKTKSILKKSGLIQKVKKLKRENIEINGR